MPLLQMATGAMLGVALGMRHALEPDHLAAVSTLVVERPRASRAAMLGLFWGLGHTLALVVVGVVLIGLRAAMPPRIVDVFELGVAVMLIALGIRAIVKAARQGPDGPAAAHRHGGFVHRHPGTPQHVHVGRLTFARRPLLIGIVHGLAGSGALTALVLATLPTSATRIVYMMLFGLGSSAGMATLSGVLGWPLARLGEQARALRTVSLVVGCLSTALGVSWGLPLVGRLVR